MQCDCLAGGFSVAGLREGSPREPPSIRGPDYCSQSVGE
jgi:hypothetical protein